MCLGKLPDKNSFFCPVSIRWTRGEQYVSTPSSIFGEAFMAAIRQAVAREALTLPEGMHPQQWLTLLTRLGHPTTTPWNVRIMER